MISSKYLTEFANETQLRAYVAEVLQQGFVVLPDFLEAEFLGEIEGFARRVYETGGGNVKRDDTPMMRLARSSEFMQFFDAVSRLRCETTGERYVPLRAEAQRAGIPYKDARGGAPTEQTHFHYDGAYVNATIGVVEPPAEQGALHLFPNFRTKFPPFLAKIVSRVLRHSRMLRSLAGYVVVPVRRNALCLFFGDRSFHGVEPITAGERLIVTINNHW